MFIITGNSDKLGCFLYVCEGDTFDEAIEVVLKEMPDFKLANTEPVTLIDKEVDEDDVQSELDNHGHCRWGYILGSQNVTLGKDHPDAITW